MFDLASGWKARMAGAVLPARSEKAGWLVDHRVEPAFVEPALQTVYGDPLLAKAIVVAAPGAVGKSTFAKTLGAETASVLVDLSRTEVLGGNFFIGGIANAFGVPALGEFADGRLGLIVDALDEAQLRSGAQGFADGLGDLARLAGQAGALPPILFGRSAAAEDAWLLLEEAGLHPCLMEIEFFDEAKALTYIKQKLPVVAGRRPQTRAAYARHPDSFLKFAVETRTKLVATPDGNDPRFAGYAPVLDAVCTFAVEDEDNLNPQARISQLSAEGPVALIAEIADAILKRERDKLVKQLRQEVELDDLDASVLYMPQEQLARLAARALGAPPAVSPSVRSPDVRREYDRMVEGFLPAHPFLDGKSELSNAAFAAYLLVWTMTSSPYPQAARQKLAARPGFGSGLLFDLYMQWLTAGKTGDRRLDLADVGALYASFALQAGPRQQASLEVTGEAGDDAVEVSFDMETPGGEDHGQRHPGPYKAALDGILEFRGTLGNIMISAPVDIIVGDGNAVCFSAPVDIDVNTLEVNARDVSVVRPSGSTEEAVQQVALTAVEADVRHVARVVVLGGRLSVTFPGDRIHPWNDHHVEPPPAPSPEIELLRRRLRRVLTAFRSHSKGAYVRLAAKIDHERMMKRDDLGPRLIERLLQDKILTMSDAGKFYVLDQDKMASFLNMDYQALHQHEWTPQSDQYLASVAR